MNIYYSEKTDYLEFFFDTKSEYYESSEDLGACMEFLSEEDDSIVGYGILDPFINLQYFDRIPANVKVALYSLIIRKKYKLTQEELAESISFSLKEVQRIENAQEETPLAFVVGLKKIDNSFDLNSLSYSSEIC